MATPEFWAHSANQQGVGIPEPLREHLSRVACRAEEFASAFGAEQQANLAGVLHDIGKYNDRFQKYLRGEINRAGDHWSMGSLLALFFAKELGACPALAIQAHHSGLSALAFDWQQYWNDLSNYLRRSEIAFNNLRADILVQRLREDGLSIPSVANGLVVNGEHPVSEMLDVRMLFSALVDADFLETEAHFEGDAATPRRPRPSGPILDIDKAIAAFEEYVCEIQRLRGDDPISSLRNELQDICRQAAAAPQGLFTLSAPTGMGKTLAMLAFALYHARQHALRRIILVMPYLSIIDQTAKVYRKIFSPDSGFAENFVLEHHSLADAGGVWREGKDQSDGEELSRLLAENWDAPIILTTNVQFLESLFSHKPSRCRKLHRMARSVVLFDEVQTLPLDLTIPTLAALSHLASTRYRATIVFATATQPAFSHLHDTVKAWAPGGWQPQEIVRDAHRFFQAMGTRVHLDWRHQTPVPLAELGEELAQYEQVLCIVNLKRHAVQLFQSLKECLPPQEQESLFHLSTSMCPLHRQDVLRQITSRLAENRPIRLISTQCVEAGIDLDFPIVYRALGPLEAIAQAAGRCNRHARRPTGRVVVFKPADEHGIYPPGYESATSATELFLSRTNLEKSLEEINLFADPEEIRKYYVLLYTLKGQQEDELVQSLKAGDFEKVAELYRLIKSPQFNVFVPYIEALYQELRDELEKLIGAQSATPSAVRRWRRRASPMAVNCWPPARGSSHWNALQPIYFWKNKYSSPVTDWYLLLPSAEYDQQLGLLFPEESSSFIV